MKLYCVRHGEALSASEDANRSLSTQGVREVTLLAKYLSACRVYVPHIMHSPKERAKQTASIIAQDMDSVRLTQLDHGLDELDPLDHMLEQIPLWHEDTMLVGHLPFMSQLVSLLVAGAADLPLVRFSPASVVCLELHEAQRWIVNWLIGPNLLVPELAANHTGDLF